MIRVVAMDEDESGLRPVAAALEQEGFEDPDPGRLIESFARHLMATVDSCREGGFGEVATHYLSRLARADGGHRDIDQNGDLLVRPAAGGKVERRSLVAALAAPSWLDPRTGGPHT
jgi:hypothetical protein